MKPLGSLRPEPPPSPGPNWLAMGLTAMTAAVYLGLFLLVRADLITDRVVILILLIATPIAAVFIALLAAEQPDRAMGYREVPPPWDLYTVWPLELGGLTGLLAERNEPLLPRKPPSAGAFACGPVSMISSRMSQAIADNVRLKRAYEPAEKADGQRILVDRLWPRGVSKTEAAIDQWMRDLAPSSELRKWFGHDPARWEEFQKRYRAEIKQHSEQLAQLRQLAEKGRLTLVYSARDEVHNDAVVLRDVLLGRSMH